MNKFSLVTNEEGTLSWELRVHLPTDGTPETTSEMVTTITVYDSDPEAVYLRIRHITGPIKKIYPVASAIISIGAAERLLYGSALVVTHKKLIPYKGNNP